MFITINEYKKYNNSKIIDNDGNLLEVYHGSNEYYDKLNAFTYFTNDYYIADGYANGNYIYCVYLNIINPLIIECNNKKWDELETKYGSSTQEVVSNVDRNKYDGIVFNNIKDSWIDDIDFQDSSIVYVPFNANQIKIISIEK